VERSSKGGEAIDAGLVVHKVDPLNAEVAIESLTGDAIVPSARFYVRSNFPVPTLDPDSWRLEVKGLVDRPLVLRLADLQAMPSRTAVVTLECAGNGRALLIPPTPGEQWGLGAVSTAEWTGVPLVEVLQRAGVRPSAIEVLFRGADCGAAPGHASAVRFERSLSLAAAHEPEVLLAYAMNGGPLPVLHGFPLRLVVPHWYAVASVKWLVEIQLVDEPFAGHFQAERYVYEWERDGALVREPVTLQQVRALITEPRAGQAVDGGDLVVRGIAWSGASPIERVDVSLDGGAWKEARLLGEASDAGWQWWELETSVEGGGTVTVRARATDRTGRTQPDRAEWNRLGYGNNSVQSVNVTIR